MATLTQIRDRIINTIQDPAYSNASVIDPYINEGIQHCASRVLLPALEYAGTVETTPGAVYVAIPSAWNFDRNLYAAVSTNLEKLLHVYSSASLFAQKYPAFEVLKTAGDIEAVAIRGTNLLYFYTPDTADTLVCSFYQKPTLLSAGEDEPSCLPDFLHYKLLVSFVCAEIFDLIEDGADGGKPNTRKHVATLEAAIDQLDAYVKAGQSKPEPDRETCWI